MMSKFQGTKTHRTQCGECANVSQKNHLETGTARNHGIWEFTGQQLSLGP